MGASCWDFTPEQSRDEIEWEDQQVKQAREQISKGTRVSHLLSMGAIYREEEVDIYTYFIGEVEYYKKILNVYKHPTDRIKVYNNKHWFNILSYIY